MSKLNRWFDLRPDRLREWAPKIRAAAATHQVDPALVAAIVCQESDHREERSIREEPTYRWFYPPKSRAEDLHPEEVRDQRHSYGLMQTMGAVLREFGCTISPLETILDRPDLQLDYGCAYLRKIIRNHGANRLSAVLCAWNAGSASSATGCYYAGDVLSRLSTMREVLS